MFDMAWVDDGGFEKRMTELDRRIESITHAGYTVSLIGASAGASAALVGYERNKSRIHAVVTLCGALGPSNSIGQTVYKVNPRFEEAMLRLPAAVQSLAPDDLRRILNAYAKQDSVLGEEHTVLAGAQYLRLPIKGHMLGVAYGLLIGVRTFVAFVRKLPEKSVV